MYSRGLDGDAALLLVLTSVGKPRFSGSRPGDDACLAHQRIREGRLAVVHVSNDGHVADVGPLVHDSTDLPAVEKERQTNSK